MSDRSKTEMGSYVEPCDCREGDLYFLPCGCVTCFCGLIHDQCDDSAKCERRAERTDWSDADVEHWEVEW